MRKDSLKPPVTLQKFGQCLDHKAHIYTVVGEDKIRFTEFRWDPNSSSFLPFGRSQFLSSKSARKVWYSWAKRGFSRMRCQSVIERWAQDIFI